MTETKPANQRLLRVLLGVAVVYLGLLIGQPAGLDVARIATEVATTPANVLQQLIIGLSNGAIIVIIALGYTLVYGIIELVNFAHGDVFMLGAFVSLLALSLFSTTTATGGQSAPAWAATKTVTLSVPSSTLDSRHLREEVELVTGVRETLAEARAARSADESVA